MYIYINTQQAQRNKFLQLAAVLKVQCFMRAQARAISTISWADENARGKRRRSKNK